jgi:diguanylate cyclase (GGDEF)-like protein
MAEAVLRLGDTLEEGVRLGQLLERLADRGALLRLARFEDRPSVQRYLDPSSNDHWAIDLPGPRPVRPRREPGPAPAPEAPAGDDDTPAEAPPSPPAEPAPRHGAPPEPPRIVLPVQELEPEPSVPHRFLDEESGEPLRTLFSTFAPCQTPEELGDALEPIREQLLRRTSATAVGFHLAGEGADLTPVPRRDHPDAPHVSLDGRIRSRVLGARRTLHVPSLAAPGTGAAAEQSGALVAMPLDSGDRLVGLMEVRRQAPGPFDEDELRFFALAALVTAGAMVRAEVLERLIYLDKLTGLYNRAYFDDQIEREIERANRSNASVALLMMDLDHFKRINDKFGHQAGDRTLAHVASLLRANIRQIDVAARYGGEEFAVLLPGTSQQRAVGTAERLRRVVAESRIGEIVPELGASRLSLSIGVALYPDDAGSSKQLIDRADRVALYSAKNRGRNRVVSWADARQTGERLRPGA